MIERAVAPSRVSCNPFSTRFVRPGALPFLFPAGVTARGLVERLRQLGWRGQILGPHGHGKSTLLRSLLPELGSAGRRVRLIELHAGDRRLPVSRSERRQWDDSTQIVVDGYEQLSLLARYRLRRSCRMCRAGLLVTCHRPRGLPTLWTVATSLELARTLTGRLIDGEESTLISPGDVQEAFLRSAGNLREAWFGLYDVYETRSQAMSTVTVNVYANLRQYTAGRPSVEVELPPGATIRSALEQLDIPVDQTRIIFVDSRAAELDDVLGGGERIDLFSAIGGG